MAENSIQGERMRRGSVNSNGFEGEMESTESVGSKQKERRGENGRRASTSASALRRSDIVYHRG